VTIQADTMLQAGELADHAGHHRPLCSSASTPPVEHPPCVPDLGAHLRSGAMVRVSTCLRMRHRDNFATPSRR